MLRFFFLLWGHSLGKKGEKGNGNEQKDLWQGKIYSGGTGLGCGGGGMHYNVLCSGYYAVGDGGTNQRKRHRIWNHDNSAAGLGVVFAGVDWFDKTKKNAGMHDVGWNIYWCAAACKFATIWRTVWWIGRIGFADIIWIRNCWYLGDSVKQKGWEIYAQNTPSLTCTNVE